MVLWRIFGELESSLFHTPPVPQCNDIERIEERRDKPHPSYGLAIDVSPTLQESELSTQKMGKIWNLTTTLEVLHQ